MSFHNFLGININASEIFLMKKGIFSAMIYTKNHLFIRVKNSNWQEGSQWPEGYTVHTGVAGGLAFITSGLWVALNILLCHAHFHKKNWNVRKSIIPCKLCTRNNILSVVCNGPHNFEVKESQNWKLMSGSPSICIKILTTKTSLQWPQVTLNLARVVVGRVVADGTVDGLLSVMILLLQTNY